MSRYNLADLDVHALTLKLFPELKGVAAGSTGELDYIDREMECFEGVLENHKKVATVCCILERNCAIGVLSIMSAPP